VEIIVRAILLHLFALLEIINENKCEDLEKLQSIVKTG